MVCGLCKTIIESSLTSTRDVRPCTFKDHAVVLVDVKPLIDHMNDKAARLRYAEYVGELRIQAAIYCQ